MLAFAAPAVGCGGEDRLREHPGAREASPGVAEMRGRGEASGPGTAAAGARSRPGASGPAKGTARSRGPGLRPVACPPALANCRAVTGRVLYVEAVDPDGDGDAHYVLAGGDITAPGLTIVDVRPALRPRRLPRVGERVSAAGPVYPGTYGQRQIEAIRLRHDR